MSQLRLSVLHQDQCLVTYVKYKMTSKTHCTFKLLNVKKQTNKKYIIGHFVPTYKVQIK